MTNEMKESLIANFKEALLETDYSPGMDEVGDESDDDVDMSPLEYDDESADSDFWLSTEEFSNIYIQNTDQIYHDNFCDLETIQS